MRVSGLVITHQLSAHAIAWMAEVAKLTDELVVVVAEERAQPEVIARFETLGARVIRPHWSGFYPSQEESREMMAACRGDWILKVDHDEELSPEWHDPSWRQVLRSSEFTHFWLPRRWALASGEFLDDEPWRPDWQLRLLRNCPEEDVLRSAVARIDDHGGARWISAHARFASSRSLALFAGGSRAESTNLRRTPAGQWAGLFLPLRKLDGQNGLRIPRISRVRTRARSACAWKR